MERRSEPVSGTKGALSDMVLHLTGRGIVAGVVTTLAVWLKRDRGRSVRLTWTVDGRRGGFTVMGATIDNDTLRSALEHGLRAAAGDSAASEARMGPYRQRPRLQHLQLLIGRRPAAEHPCRQHQPHHAGEGR
ncbi:hypothetical protein ACFXPQ_04990 [Streptomyces lydicus]|uniref:effector-associated constant component EACC1 n=1 Tax=Streptomyces lydicus TaxID=47763 RepID=UPI0036CCD27B